ncbi:serine/threonine-protein kinase [Streptomyces sp. URMC 127]|uniref:serine/threonine-protein kinase n=1 Tax=Streptomyces sp. URMC 127 TaxID=3423402 RepID=UPI003F1A43A8
MHGPAGEGSGSDAAELLPPGHLVGRWEVTAPLGTGGWATVYAARRADGRSGAGEREDTDGGDAGEGTPRVPLPRDVALKFLPTGGLAPSQARKVAETARREVEFGRRTRHPRIIRLLDSFVLSEPGHPLLDGAIVLVMERAERSLRDLLDATSRSGQSRSGQSGSGPGRSGPGRSGIDEATAEQLLTEICEGLAHLHRSGWVHGDLKPDNVLLMPDGSARLSDFGLATELTGTRGTHGYGPPMGTFDYLPPERWKAPLGEHGVQVRPSADVWALGIVIHEVFTAGASPFPGATPVARAAAAQEYADGRAPLRMDDAVPPFWRALAADCLAPAHATRAVHTAESLLARIAEHRATAPAAPPRPRGDEEEGAAAVPGTRRRRRIRAGLVAVAVCGAVAAGWSYAVRDHGSGPLPRPGASTAAAAAGAASGPSGHLRVFNAERGCRERTDRDPQCSLGMAIDPRQPYTIDNVVPVRVWHGDVLDAECRLPGGVPIVDEAGTWSADWYRVRLPRGSARSTAWLPAVRTQDRPGVPQCPAPGPAR